jgi:hypothetical protein
MGKWVGLNFRVINKDSVEGIRMKMVCKEVQKEVWEDIGCFVKVSQIKVCPLFMVQSVKVGRGCCLHLNPLISFQINHI